MRRLSIILVVPFFLSACMTTSQPAGEANNDPFEGWNRSVYAFNETADKYAIAPIASVYKAVTPGFARDGIGNALANLNAPVILINDVLQAEPGRALDTTLRFAINSTIGVLGLWDAAEEFGIEKHSEDFGQTLAVWGVGEGPYLVLPFLGPSNMRDAFGSVVDIAFDPLTWTEFSADENLDDYILIGRVSLNALNTRVNLDEQIDTLRAQPEPYVALRRLYSSQREAAIRNGEEAEDQYEDLPDFDEFFDDEDGTE